MLVLKINAFSAPPRLVVKTRTFSDGIAIRWTPASYELWQKWNKNGYRMERHTLQSNNKNSNDPLLIGGASIVPYNDSQLEVLSKTKRDAGLIQSCLNQWTNLNSKSELLKLSEMKDQCYIFSMLAMQKDFELTMAAGLGIVDVNTEPNTIYQYKLYPIDATAIDTQYLILNTSQITEYPIIEGLNTYLQANRIQLQWNANKFTNNYFAYQIERSLDSGKTYSTISEQPIMGFNNGYNNSLTTYYDSIFQYENWILYRIKGIDYFGQPSLPSSTDTVTVHFETEAFPSQVTSIFSSINTLQINWNFDTLENKNIKGFKLSICDSSEGEYKSIDSIPIDSKTRSVILKTDQSICYIRVNAITLNQHLNPSFQSMAQQVDSTPPPVPIIIASQIDSNGYLKLIWQKSNASDFLSYRVYKANNRFDEYSVYTPQYFEDTFYCDSIDLNLIRDSIYYKLSSIDSRYNESQQSAAIAIKIHHKIPASPPLLYAIENTSNSLNLKWHKSNSNGVISYELHTQNKATKLIKVCKLKAQDSTYCDSSLDAGETYSLTLYAISQNGTVSKSVKAIEIKRPSDPWMPAIDNIITDQDTSKNQVILIWNYPYDAEVKHYRILAKKPDGRLETIGTIPNGTNYYTHYYLKPYTMKQFIIIAYFKDGRRSKS